MKYQKENRYRAEMKSGLDEWLEWWKCYENSCEHSAYYRNYCLPTFSVIVVVVGGGGISYCDFQLIY